MDKEVIILNKQEGENMKEKVEEQIENLEQDKHEKCECQNKVDQTCECDEQHLPTSKEEKKHKKHKLEGKIAELEKKLLESEEKVLLSKAELVNYRKRKDDEIERIRKYASEDVIVSILPTLDNFERAIKMDDDNLEDEVSKFLSGFKMIYSHLRGVLENHKVKAIDGNNKPFDPVYHQAMLTEKKDGIEPGVVIEVLQKGYLLDDKVIRPAMVKVSE